MATQAPTSTIQPATASGSGEEGFQRDASHGTATSNQNSVATPQTERTIPRGHPMSKPANGESRR